MPGVILALFLASLLNLVVNAGVHNVWVRKVLVTRTSPPVWPVPRAGVGLIVGQVTLSLMPSNAWIYGTIYWHPNCLRVRLCVHGGCEHACVGAVLQAPVSVQLFPRSQTLFLSVVRWGSPCGIPWMCTIRCVCAHDELRCPLSCFTGVRCVRTVQVSNDITVTLMKLAEYGLSPVQLVMSILLVIIGFITYALHYRVCLWTAWASRFTGGLCAQCSLQVLPFASVVHPL